MVLTWFEGPVPLARGEIPRSVKPGKLRDATVAQGGAVQDVAAIVGGLALYALLLFWGHQKLTGVPLIS
jgi:hypothetical protein